MHFLSNDVIAKYNLKTSTVLTFLQDHIWSPSCKWVFLYYYYYPFRELRQHQRNPFRRMLIYLNLFLRIYTMYYKTLIKGFLLGYFCHVYCSSIFICLINWPLLSTTLASYSARRQNEVNKIAKEKTETSHTEFPHKPR